MVFHVCSFLGRRPLGKWTLILTYRGPLIRLQISDVEFTFYGTTSTPEVISRIPAQCDDACARRCAAPGPEFCDACRQFRDAETLECVNSCASGLTERSGYCYDASKTEDLSTCGNFDDDTKDASLSVVSLSMINLLFIIVYAMMLITLMG